MVNGAFLLGIESKQRSANESEHMIPRMALTASNNRAQEHRAEGGAEAEDEEEEEGYAFGRDSVLAAIEAVRQGKCVVVTDDEGRENEGDIVFAAEKVMVPLGHTNFCENGGCDLACC